jgi:hypothetical protein
LNANSNVIQGSLNSILEGNNNGILGVGNYIQGKDNLLIGGTNGVYGEANFI